MGMGQGLRLELGMENNIWREWIRFRPFIYQTIVIKSSHQHLVAVYFYHWKSKKLKKQYILPNQIKNIINSLTLPNFTYNFTLTFHRSNEIEV